MVETIDSPEVREAERIRKQRIIDENAAFLRGGGGANININVGAVVVVVPTRRSAPRTSPPRSRTG